ncbi:hypothetical protein EJ04DRAFT_565820 [Polyplosphaeria fusca]|uniref:Uncharacterized protein n=1 Tax=Polyplosphaeria fusca TaxID=682080 RepID=A0A9P4V105_9PLEO|nr:hypothetical protein EJ04DRAFT_565820 [Polyplosphaeria fusca]
MSVMFAHDADYHTIIKKILKSHIPAELVMDLQTLFAMSSSGAGHDEHDGQPSGTVTENIASKSDIPIPPTTPSADGSTIAQDDRERWRKYRLDYRGYVESTERAILETEDKYRTMGICFYHLEPSYRYEEALGDDIREVMSQDFDTRHDRFMESFDHIVELIRHYLGLMELAFSPGGPEYRNVLRYTAASAEANRYLLLLYDRVLSWIEAIDKLYTNLSVLFVQPRWKVLKDPFFLDWVRTLEETRRAEVAGMPTWRIVDGMCDEIDWNMDIDNSLDMKRTLGSILGGLSVPIHQETFLRRTMIGVERTIF